MHVAAGRALWSVEVSMGVKPDQPHRLLPGTKVFRHTSKSAYGDGMVPSQHDGQACLFQSLLDKTRQVLAGLQDFLQKLAVAVSIVQGLGNAHRNITRIQDGI